MRTSQFIAMLQERWKAKKFVCVGLDSDFQKLPESIKRAHPSSEEALFAFNAAIIDATHEYASAFKPNSGFYEAEGEAGWRALKRTSKYLKEKHPDIPMILDAKRGDLGNTNEAYARAIFDDLEMDAVTANPYMGGEALKPFLDRKDKGIFVMVKTSNPGSGEFQDAPVGEKSQKLYRLVAEHVVKWNTNGNCGVVVGATYPDEMSAVRKIVGDMPILVPGVGAQGGDVKKTVRAGIGAHGFGLVINSSRGIIFASAGEDFADAARKNAQSLSEEVAKAIA